MPRKKGRPDAGNIRSGRREVSNKAARVAAATSRSEYTNDSRKSQAKPQDDDTGSAPSLPEVLDATCTASAIVANRLAATARFLDHHERQGLDLGRDVARVARMAVTTAEATEMLHQVARDYADWMVPAA